MNDSCCGNVLSDKIMASPVVGKETVKDDTFTVIRQKNDVTGEDVVQVVLLSDALREHCGETLKNDSFWISGIKHDIMLFMPLVRHMKNWDPNHAFYSFFEFLKNEFNNILAGWKSMKKKNLISFNFLPFLFEVGQSVYGELNGEIIGGPIEECQTIRTFFGSYFRLQLKTIRSNGRSLLFSSQDVNIPSFTGMVNIDDLPVKPLDKNSKTYNTLVERGKTFRDIAYGANYMHYDGQMIIKNNWFETFLHATGRVVIDVSSHIQRNQDYELRSLNEDRHDNVGNKVELTDDLLYMTHPFTYGFSMRLKRWGKICVSGISKIEYREKAFQQLVLDENKKKLIHSLVTESKDSFKDVVSDKGGGCIFLLHGPPGVGKTLTAESIADYLHRPLYSVSVGELGVNPDSLETNLRNILELGSHWNAVILIDEADIFLSARNTNDINRNAMVGIFLKLLEYHQGVMFLTTNMVDTFDKAFLSRISLSINYPDHTVESLEKIWSNLFEAAGIKGLNAKSLAKKYPDLNGRFIKTVIRIAQTVAKTEGKKKVLMKHIHQVISLRDEFNLG